MKTNLIKASLVQDHPIVHIIKAVANVFFISAGAIFVSIITAIGSIIIGLTKIETEYDLIEHIFVLLFGALVSVICMAFGCHILMYLKKLDYGRLVNEMKG